ncbi:LysE family translocator [Candidatus Bathyarchaeota archaeon]|nr:LysE family translocator [Candidatus Bathyarchaeota archaeon]
MELSPSFPAFLATVVVVTASGALAPGPLFAANLLQGTKGGMRSGFMISVGHTLVELPLVTLIALGISSMMSFPGFSLVVGLVGGCALIGFGLVQIVGAARHQIKLDEVQEAGIQKKALVLGVGLTALNPYFILWWLTVGLGLVVQAVELGALLGVLIMYVSHVWMDYAWLTGTAYLSARGMMLIGGRGYRLLLLGLAAFLIYFGVGFVARSLFQFNMLP